MAARQQQVRLPDRVDDVEDAEVARAQRVPLHLDLDLADLAAADVGAGDAVDALDLRLDGVVGEIVELPLVQPLAADRDLHDGDVGDVELDDERLLDARRQRVQDLRHALRHLELRVVQVDAVVEPDADRREPLPRLALDAVDARRRAHRALDRLGDRLLDVGRTRARVEGRRPG